jgi:hypothetical protein
MDWDASHQLWYVDPTIFTGLILRNLKRATHGLMFSVIGVHQLFALVDELIQGGVDDGHCLCAPFLTGHNRPQQRDVPVRDRICGPVLGLPQRCVHRLKTTMTDMSAHDNHLCPLVGST